MVDTTASTPAGSGAISWLDNLSTRRKETGLGLLIATVLLALLPAWLGYQFKWDYLYVAIATGFLPLVTLGGGLYQLLREPNPKTDRDQTLLLVMTLGALLGFGLVLVGIAFAFHAETWKTATAGIKTWMTKEGWRFWLTVLTPIAGLAIMFVFLQLGRGKERTEAYMRRVIYGFNAFLTCLLVLGILIVANVLAAMNLPERGYDWTAKNLYSLSQESITLLEKIDQPVKIYAILPQEDRLDTYRKVRALLGNCQSYTRKIDVEYLSPDLDRESLKELAEKYKVSEREGLLVVYGVEPKEQSQFITVESLYTGSGPSFVRARDSRMFKGESELIQVLSQVAGGKEKPILYFTQGHGELDLKESGGGNEPNQGAGEIKRKLEDDKFTIKGLLLDPARKEYEKKNPDVTVTDKVPDDASIVVVAGPQNPLPESTLKALREYMEPASPTGKKGKLVVLLDPAVSRTTGKLERTGIEDFLANFSVQVGDNRVMKVPLDGIPPGLWRNLLWVPAMTNPAEDVRRRNPIAGAFYRRNLFWFYEARSVQPMTMGRPPTGKYRVDALLLVPDEVRPWAETDFSSRIKPKPGADSIPIAVAVTEGGGSDPHAAFMDTPDQKPRMVVIGDVTMISNFAIAQGAFGKHYDLFQSILVWLGERPGTIGIQPKVQDTYEFNSNSVDMVRLLVLPAVIMLVGVVGVGTGVWVVRRR